ncbi:MAG: hypothetical protein LBS79_03325 [Tannerella sp.]|nr:hypothetical protein [Tannerella sp.]
MHIKVIGRLAGIDSDVLLTKTHMPPVDCRLPASIDMLEGDAHSCSCTQF